MTPEHPDDDTWEKLACGELPGDEKAKVLKHVVSCATCARTWRALRQVASEARAFDPGIPATAPDEGSGRHVVPFARTRRALIAGGVVAIAAAAALLLWFRFAGTSSTDNDDTSVRGDGSARVVLLVRATSSRLAWSAVPGADSYTVTVFSSDGRPVLERDRVTTTELALERLPAGDYLWRVEATKLGKRIAVSQPGHFSVSP